MMAVPASRLMAAKTGPRKITSQRRNFITSPSITLSPITFMARNRHIIYSNNEGFINRYDKNKEEVQDVSPVPLDNSGHGAADHVHRFQWVTPLMLSPHNPDVIYTAGESVFKSTDHGQSWAQISGDLTRNDKSKQQPSGGPLTNDITSV